MFIYLSIIFLTLILDFIWLYLNANMYKKLVYEIQGFDLNINYLGAILSYLCLILALLIFVFPLIKNEYYKNKKQSLLLLAIKNGGLLGLLMYGMFNTTNIGIFKNYHYTYATMDTIWGFFLFSFISYIYLIFLQKFY
jgi:uncharacterized membrane protein